MYSLLSRTVALAAICFAASAWCGENAITQWHLEPFWEGNTMHGESLFFLEPKTGAPATAGLLFTPGKILAMTHPASGASFEEGRDFTVNRDTKQLTLTADTRIPFTTRAEFEPALGASGQMYRDKTRDIFFENEHRFHDLQVEITYEHGADAWAMLGGSTPLPATEHLSDFLAKLHASEPVTICLLGDSISFGLNASGVVDVAPHQPAYGTLFAQGLEARFGSPVNYTNFSISGKSTPWGIEQAPVVAEKKPDLVIIAFGMNDASGRIAPETFLDYTQKIMEGVEAGHPSTSFLLVSTMRGNPHWVHAAPEFYPQYRDALLTAEGPGVAVADLTTFWTTLLEHKTYADITGNGVNHPNDFGHRVYAQVLLSLFPSSSEH